MARISASRVSATIVIALLTLGIMTEPAYTQDQQPTFILVLDPGHDPAQGGAIGATGIREVIYNDRLVEAIRNELTAIEHLQVVITRKPDEALGLQERAEIANQMQANLFISVHHDSAQEKYLKTTDNAKIETITPIQGFSIFVSRHNSEYEKSLKFAEMLGEEMRQEGRRPTLHHAENIAGENRPLLKPELGVYQFDDLLVLKNTHLPAILFEAGVIVDAEDEQLLSDGKTIKTLANAVKKAVFRYIKTVSH